MTVPSGDVEVVRRPACQTPHHHTTPRRVSGCLHPLPCAASVVEGVTYGRRKGSVCISEAFTDIQYNSQVRSHSSQT